MLLKNCSDMEPEKLNQDYIPRPVDMSDIELSPAIEELIEQIARNVHEVWAQSRQSMGWTWGAVRNDELKKHPCLVPYDQLTEVEKQYDRDTAVCTIKFILKQGFKISK